MFPLPTTTTTTTTTPVSPKPTMGSASLPRAAKIAISFTIPALFGIALVAFIFYRWRTKPAVMARSERMEEGQSAVAFMQCGPGASFVSDPRGEAGVTPQVSGGGEGLGISGTEVGGGVVKVGGGSQVGEMEIPVVQSPGSSSPGSSSPGGAKKLTPPSPVRRKPVPATPPGNQTPATEEDEEMRWLREEQERVKERRERLKKLEQLDDEESRIKHRIWEKSQLGGRA